MRNTFHFTEKEKDNTRYLILDTSKTVFRNFQWNDLGDWGKRKAENMVFLENMNEGRKHIKVKYVEAY